MSAPIVLTLRLFLAVALYAFLGWAFVTLWRELRNQSLTLESRKVPGISLMVQNGDMPPSLRHFSQAEILMGRDSHCDIPLDDNTVSSRHARLVFHHGQWWLEDLGSTNGTRLNNEPLTIPTVVIGGDQVSCGKTTLTINLGVDILSSPTVRIPGNGEKS